MDQLFKKLSYSWCTLVYKLQADSTVIHNCTDTLKKRTQWFILGGRDPIFSEVVPGMNESSGYTGDLE